MKIKYLLIKLKFQKHNTFFKTVMVNSQDEEQHSTPTQSTEYFHFPI